MSLLDDITSSASSGSGTLLDTLTTDDGTGVDAGTLGTFSLGLIVTAWAESASELISTLFGAFVVSPLDQLSGLLEVLAGFWGLGGAAWSSAWQTTAQWVTGFGWLAFPAATVVVVTLAYLVVTGWSLNA